MALPTACAVGVDPTFVDDGTDDGGGAGTAPVGIGGTLGTSGSGTTLPKAGTSTGGSAVVSPFGGSASAGTSAGGGSAAGSSAGGASSAGSSAGGRAGAGGTAAGGTGAGGTAAGGTGTGGTGGGTCACPVKKVWADNTTMTIAPGDCVEVAGAIYLYSGAKTQTWANKDCNPTMQLAWCSDMGADYKFVLCK